MSARGLEATNSLFIFATEFLIIMAYFVNPDSALIEAIIRDSTVIDSVSKQEVAFLGGPATNLAHEIAGQASQLLIAHPPSWYFVMLFLLLAAIAISQVIFGDLLKGTFQSAIRYSVTVGMYNDNSLVQRQKDNILYATYFISSAFFILIVEQRYSIYPFQMSGFLLFLLNLGFLVGLFFLRIIVINLVAYIFNKRRLFQEYLYHNFSLNKLFGLLFIPLDFLAAYTVGKVHDISIYAAICLFGMLLAMKIGKGIIFAVKKDIFNFYLFLYLCALEIVPILLIYKWITTVV